jgi:hypothetical protein
VQRDLQAQQGLKVIRGLLGKREKLGSKAYKAHKAQQVQRVILGPKGKREKLVK